MKFLPFRSFTALLFVLGYVACAADRPSATIPAAGATGAGPRIQFDSLIYDFKRVMTGELVKHDFIFTNTGSETLEVTGVYPGCGCTTAGAWTRRVEPGQTGTIPLEFDSGRFPGQTVMKTVTVACNDKTQPSVILQIKGTIWAPVEITPQTAVLNIITDEPSNAPVVVRIVSNLEEPITLSEPQVSNRSFTADLKTIQAGKEFQLSLRALPPLPQGNSSCVVSMKTTSTNVPTINVTAVAVVQPPLTVMPPELTLTFNGSNAPPAFTVFVRNNSANHPLTLSEPKFSDPRVGVQMKELVPGVQFTITLNFPPGFQIPQNGKADLTVKTSSPKFPEIKVPVRQLPPTPVNTSAPVPVPSLSH